MNHLDFEEYLIEILRKQGFKRVFTTKSTDDLCVQITCMTKKGKDKIAIHVKKNNSPLSGKTIQEVIDSAPRYNATKTMVITNSTFTPKAKILAKSNNCELIDRNLLKKWVYENENTSKKRNQTETHINKSSENNSLAVAINPLTPSAQYMNFEDVPFTPDADEILTTENDDQDVDINKNIESSDLPTKEINSSSHPETSPLELLSDSNDPSKSISDINNIEIIQDKEANLVVEQDEEANLVVVDQDEEANLAVLDESEYDTNESLITETVSENFFDDL